MSIEDIPNPKGRKRGDKNTLFEISNILPDNQFSFLYEVSGSDFLSAKQNKKGVFFTDSG